MLDIVDHRSIANDDAAEGGKRFAKGAHDEIDIVRQTKVSGCTAPLTQDPQGMRVIHH